MIEVQDLSFAYNKSSPIFENLSFHVNDGELLILRGVSGRGKTTLLYCLCGIIPRNISGSMLGNINIDGKPVADMSVAELACAVAVVFQEPGSRLFLPSVEDELAFTLENMCVERDEMRERIAHALDITGLADKRYESPAKLSGGQVKLLALASVLVFPPRVLLLDEITAGLDRQAVERVINCADSLRKQGCAIIASEHNAGIWGDANELRI